jgi:hypothetical protein
MIMMKHDGDVIDDDAAGDDDASSVDNDCNHEYDGNDDCERLLLID